MTWVRAGAGSALATVVVLLGAGCGERADSAEGRPDGRLVLVSGRDDHGNLSLDAVPVYDGPGQAAVVGRVTDGTLARVTDVDGQMLEVVTAEGDSVAGWVDDFHLRGVLHLVGPAPTCRARLAGSLREPGMQVVVMGVRNGEVLLQAVADPEARGWAAREFVRELPPQGPSCDAEPGDGGHAH
jgi:hypothetical protein